MMVVVGCRDAGRPAEPLLMNRVPLRSTGTALAIALVVAAVSTVDAAGAEPTFTTRDELIRKWDLDKDGSVDEGEVEIARSKMRRERAELQMQSGIDPLTGRPRLTPEEEEAAAEELNHELPEAEQPRPRKGGRDQALPGTRLPDVLPPIPAATDSRPPATDAPRDDAPRAGAAASPPRGPGRVTFRGLSAGEDRGVVTGGARAGGVARPGYGAAVPKPDLNAGRLPAGLPGRRPAPASGGLLPNLRTRPTVPAPPSTTPRRTVDDYDVY